LVDDEVPQAHGARFETGDRPGRVKRPLVERRSVVHLGPDTGGIIELDQVDHAALIRLVARTALHPHAGVFQSLRDRVQRGCVGHLPADDLEIIGPVVAELDAVGVLVHPKVRRGVGVARHELHAEHAGGEPAPGREVADPENEVAELIHARHDILLR